ncbi:MULTISPECIES: hypothetical protein [Pseudomonas]|uniref:hypothetical protein n=1 Tax=Pseudomonas TaxID=286 RepID=UPI0021F7D970|nr:hypothetical protein [Pseudomonas sp. BT-42-2]MCV9920531.1 hypothetical protein [Pseudomonas sp. BT-42-2]
MIRSAAHHCSSWSLPILLCLSVALSAGCSSKHASPRHATAQVGSNCFATAVPSSGEGGLAFGDTLSMARKKSMDSCIRYAGRSGGEPRTCQVVMAKCK